MVEHHAPAEGAGERRGREQDVGRVVEVEDGGAARQLANGGRVQRERRGDVLAGKGQLAGPAGG